MRKAGVLLHPTSLPHGVLDHHVEKFLDWMVAAGLSVWQMLPLGVPNQDRSPYQCYSAYALNPALLPNGAVCHNSDEDGFSLFCHNEGFWLNDYALFMVLKQHHGYRLWSQWPDCYRYRDTTALAQFALNHQHALRAIKKEQYTLFTLWQRVRESAHQRGIQLFGDVPIAVSYDSADVWSQPQLFKLDEQLQPTVVAGVPPDYFSETGQLWGNPHYNWSVMQQDDFNWWRSRMANVLRQFDFVRIDHFRGLQALWEVPADATTAIDGCWVETPGRELLTVLKIDFPHMPFVAEDLGLITPEVTALRDDFQLPGLSVLHFGFDGTADNPHDLANQEESTVVYTGTHDNNTTCGWFDSLPAHVQQQVLAKLPTNSGEMPWPMIVAALYSPARLAIIPMQDWLALDSSHRTNTPGTVAENWRWRFHWDQVPETLAMTIHHWLQHSGRILSKDIVNE
ncbi:MAG: 4-alpha-glucanotransferase [Deltaproteobacteria bacterium]|nr:4-alpha-glucanotransferase [Deltaproteobacteria bacterium]